MARTEDGEFEFVVGNRHLLSAIFVLMVLFGIFFSLGYFVGRSGDGTSAPTQTAAASGGGVSQPQEAPPMAASETPVGPGEAQVAAPAESTQTVVADTRSVEPVQEAAPPAAEPARAAAFGPQPGETFLQVGAYRHREAMAVVDVLRAKGFNALTAPVVVNGVASNSLFRALVGPIKDSGDLARLRSELQAAGLTPYVQKY